jgi:two-component system chemotaxis response regulator CheB
MVTQMKVKIAEHGEFIHSGVVYVAPSGIHMTLTQNLRIHLEGTDKVNFVCPAVDVTMESIKAQSHIKLIGIILTGMGKDGAKGIAYMKSINAITIAQDKETSIIYGMPQEAAQTGKIDYILSTNGIKNKLIELIPTQLVN